MLYRMTDFETEKTRASDWFRTLRDRIVAEFHAIEDRHDSDAAPGRVEVTKTKRSSDDGSDAGGGEMNVMRGGRACSGRRMPGGLAAVPT